MLSRTFRANLVRFILLSLPASLLLLPQGCSISSSPGDDAAQRQQNPCGEGGEPWRPPYPVVKTTVEPDGTIVDWVSYRSIFPDGMMPAPPPDKPPTPDHPNPVITPQQSQAPSKVYVGDALTPYHRPKGLHCTCHPGYIARPGQPCVELSKQCSGPGSTASGKTFSACCPGLTRISPVTPQNGVCQQFPFDYVVCTECGNGQCGPGENYCNCPKDCPKP